MESETLREQIKNILKKSESDNSEQRSTADAAPTEPIVASPMKASTLAETLLELIGSILSSENLEYAGTQLAAWLKSQDIASAIYTKSRQEQIWVSSEGGVDDHS
jgi:hypothetical protein